MAPGTGEIPPELRPRAAYREFIPCSDSCLNARGNFKLHILCERCEQMKEFIKSNWKQIPRQTERLILPTVRSGVELEESSRRCHSCTLIRESRFEEDMGQMSWGLGLSHSAAEAVRTSRLEFLRRATIRFIIKAWGEAGPRGEVSATVTVEASTHLETATSAVELHETLAQGDSIDNASEIVLDTSVTKKRASAMNNRIMWSTSNDSASEDDEAYDYTPRWQKPPLEICSISTASPESTILMKYWFYRCISTHVNCQLKRYTSWQTEEYEMPKRLLRLYGPNENILVKLVNQSAIRTSNSQVGYAALSYCWGGLNSFTLTSTTAGRLVAGVAVSEFPPTIRDAVRITRILGLNFLWVDSLCIFQDSRSDWEEQSSIMGDVYGGCIVCIAAVGASNATDGLFSKRDPLKYAACRMFTSEAGGTVWLTSTGRTQEWIDKWPLYHRGWVMQERLLPPRTIKFGPYLSWECREFQADEFARDRPHFLDISDFNDCSLTGAFFKAVSHNQSMQNLYERTEESLKPWGRHTGRIVTLWSRIIEDYSACSLSRKSDRLVAISGIISTIQNRTGWVNLSGLWRPKIISELLWKTHERQRKEPARTGLWPSWSWAATDARINGDYYICSGTSDLDDIAQYMGKEEIMLGSLQKPLQAISIKCLAIKIERQRGVGKTGGREEDLIISEAKTEGMRIKFVKDFLTSTVMPQLFLVLSNTIGDNRRVEGLIVGLYPSRHTPYLFQRLGRASGVADGPLRPSCLKDDALRKIYRLV